MPGTKITNETISYSNFTGTSYENFLSNVSTIGNTTSINSVYLVIEGTTPGCDQGNPDYACHAVSPMFSVAVDKKIDDGRPGTGDVLAAEGFYSGGSCSTADGQSHNTIIVAGDYISSNLPGCTLSFRTLKIPLP